MLALKLAATVAVAAHTAFAATTVDPYASREAMHLVNCQPLDPSQPWNSEMWYYKNNTVSEPVNGVIDGDVDDTTEVSINGRVTWEGATVNGFFEESNKSFSSKINANAQSQALDTQVGTGSGYDGNASWNCYKDDSRDIGGALQTCFSIYFCYKK